MRLVKSLSLTNRFGSRQKSRDVTAENYVSLKPETIFLGNIDLVKRQSNKKPQSLDWVQDAWKMVEETTHSSTNEDKTSTVSKSLTPSNSSNSSDHTEPAADDVVRPPPAVTRPSPYPTTTRRESQSFRQRRGEIQEKKRIVTPVVDRTPPVDMPPMYEPTKPSEQKIEKPSSAGRKVVKRVESDRLRSKRPKLPIVKEPSVGKYPKENDTLADLLLDAYFLEADINTNVKPTNEVSRLVKLQKRFHNRTISQKGWKELLPDEQSQFLDIESVCLMSLGTSAPKTSPNKDVVAPSPISSEKKTNNKALKNAREQFKTLTEREKKLDFVRKNARENWTTLTAQEQVNIDFVLAALESPELPETSKKPFDWIKDDELLEQGVVVLAIFRNESAFALLGEDYRLPSNLLGDRTIMLEYLQARRTFKQRGNQVPTPAIVMTHDDAESDELSSLGESTKYHSAHKRIPVVPKQNQTENLKTVAFADSEPNIIDLVDQISFSSTAIPFCAREDDESLSTYHESDLESIPECLDDEQSI